MKFESYFNQRKIEDFAKEHGVDPVQLKMGFKVEKEHDGRFGKDTDVVNSTEDVLKIAVAHLREDPKYYTKLKTIEQHG